MEGIRTVSIEGHPTRLLDRGHGSPVLVLHGWGGRIESMMPVIDCLTGSFRVIAIDLPGFGESPAPTTAWSTWDYADYVVAALAELSVTRTKIVGHSYGAKTSLVLSAERPEIVEKMLLVGSSGLRSAPSPKVRLKRAASRLGSAAAKAGPPGRMLKQAIHKRVASADYRNSGDMRQTLVRVVNEDLTEILPRIKASTLLVWGTLDDSVPVAHARTMERLIPDAGLVLFEGAGHFAYLDEPKRFCTIARHFFQPSSAA